MKIFGLPREHVQNGLAGFSELCEVLKGYRRTKALKPNAASYEPVSKTPQEDRDLLTAEINAFEASLGEKYPTMDYLIDLMERCANFRLLTEGLPENESKLCKTLLQNAAQKFIEGSARLVGNYEQETGQMYGADKRNKEPLQQIYVGLVKTLGDKDLPKGVKNYAKEVAIKMTKIGGLDLK